MPTRVFAASGDSGKVYLIGRVGLDNPGDDVGLFSYTGTYRTDRHSPAGQGGLALFRRVRARIWHTGAFDVTMKCFVDGAQTQLFDVNSVAVDQVITFSVPAPTTVGPDGGFETVLTADIEARGTYIEVEFAIDISTLTGVVLPESMETGHRVIRAGLEGSGETQ